VLRLKGLTARPVLERVVVDSEADISDCDY
jgi:hypothetical protein